MANLSAWYKNLKQPMNIEGKQVVHHKVIKCLNEILKQLFGGKYNRQLIGKRLILLVNIVI